MKKLWAGAVMWLTPLWITQRQEGKEDPQITQIITDKMVTVKVGRQKKKNIGSLALCYFSIP